MSTVKNLFFSVLTVCIVLIGHAQDKEYAKKCIKKLSSNSLHGRGYVKKGSEKAAKFIANQFEDIGLLAFESGYFQPFNFSVNSFPGKMKLEIDGHKLDSGYDFLISANSPGIKGEFPVHLLSSFSSKENLLKTIDSYKKDFVLVIDKSQFTNLSLDEKKEFSTLLFTIQNFGYGKVRAIVELTTEKLTWSGSTKLVELPKFIIQKEKVHIDESSLLYFNVQHKFHSDYKGDNVIAYLPGDRSDSVLLVTAHYDHLGRMGRKSIFPGANDNASGVSMMLNLAKELKAENRKYDIVFIAFAGEEIGLLGSAYFVDHPIVDLRRIKFLVNLDLAGTGDDGIRIVNGTIYKEQFKKIQQLNKEKGLLTAVKNRGASCNSDHCHFHAKNVPSFFIYTLGGIKAYHDVYDRYETLPLTEYDDYFVLLKGFIQSL